MLPKITAIGNLTRDIELRYTQSGTAVASTAIACSDRRKGADGQQREETTFIDLTFWGRSAEIANQYLGKGSKIFIEGRLKQEQWAAQDGTKRSRHVVTVENMQMLGCKGEGQPGPTQPPAQPAPQQPANPQPPEINIDENEIPF